MRFQTYLLHGYVGNAFTKNQDPTQEDPQDPGPPQGSKEATGTASPPKAPKQAKNTPKSTQKHQNAPQSGGTGVPPAPPEREGEPKQRANKIMFPSLDRPLAVFIVIALDFFWSEKFFGIFPKRKSFLFVHL